MKHLLSLETNMKRLPRTEVSTSWAWEGRAANEEVMARYMRSVGLNSPRSPTTRSSLNSRMLEFTGCFGSTVAVEAYALRTSTMKAGYTMCSIT